jgi:hypothetical protein
MPDGKPSKPRTFYLNEQHELSREEKPGGGRVPAYIQIDWASKAKRISTSLERVQKEVARSKDPLRDHHYFVLAKPVGELKKASKDKRKAPEGFVTDKTVYSEKDSRTFRRLGIDLLQVTEDGSALVHMRPERLNQLKFTAAELMDVGIREQVRWATIDIFDLVPPELRVDEIWLQHLAPNKVTSAVIEFQPVLSRLEADILLRTISTVLNHERDEALVGMGTDFSGRQWLRARLTPDSIRAVAKTFYSVQSVHSPLLSVAAAVSDQRRSVKEGRPVQRPQAVVDIANLPSVAILDTGVPREHVTEIGKPLVRPVRLEQV